VCHALLPQVEEVLKEFPKIKSGVVNAGDITEVAGYLSIFTVPALLLFVDGKETLREARFIHIEPFREKLKKIYSGVFDHE
jgi:thiol-disulfide isomerase/thioredoxin